MADAIDLAKDKVLDNFHETAGAAIAAPANGWVPVTVSDEQAATLPWAAQYLQCSKTATADCKNKQYTAGCWVEREVSEPTRPCCLLPFAVCTADLDPTLALTIWTFCTSRTSRPSRSKPHKSVGARRGTLAILCTR